ncbi:hypothetical protein HK405_013394, partial [Cladochytrium tenue]
MLIEEFPVRVVQRPSNPPTPKVAIRAPLAHSPFATETVDQLDDEITAYLNRAENAPEDKLTAASSPKSAGEVIATLE